MEKWRFPSNDYGENKGINDSGISMFRGTPLKSLAREICQNSLDAARKEKVIIQFNMFEIETKGIPGKDALADAYEKCYDFWKDNYSTKVFFQNAKKQITKENCSILRISDFNTTGLTGADKEVNSDWINLTKSSGVSDKRTTAGGSYGIGKFAPFACSDLATVFYSTYDLYGKKASQGVSRLVTFTRDDNQNTQGVGYYGEEYNKPMKKELCLDPSFHREDGEYGTDIFIVGYKYKNENWKKDIIVAVLDGFIGALWNSKLEVQVGDLIVNKDNLGKVIDMYSEDLTGYSNYYFDVLESKDTIWAEDNFMGMGNIRLGLLPEKEDVPKRIAMIRQTGMKIMDKDHLPGNISFVGVMFIEGKEINEKLRAIENPEHTRWEPSRASNPVVAKQLLKSINDFIKEHIEKLINNSSDKAIDVAGAGNYIPDAGDSSDDQMEQEVVSERIKEVEIRKIEQKSLSKTTPGNLISEFEKQTNGHMEPDGQDIAWFHSDGKTEEHKNKPGQDAHPELGGKQKITQPLKVSSENIVCLCINKNEGKYMIRLIPSNNANNGVLELYMSGENQRYPAQLKSVSLIGKGNLNFDLNKITGLSFQKDKEIRLSIEIDYHDYCSMEVQLYATEK